MDNRSSGLSGIVALVVCVVGVLAARAIFPGIVTVLLWIGGILLVLIAALVALVIWASTRKTEEPKEGQTDPKSVISRARATLLELRRLSMQVKDLQIRQRSGEICKWVEKILVALKEQPEDLPNVRQFLNYYLPTLKTILSKYIRLENSGVPAEDMRQSTARCLGDIQVAMQRQYDSLFDDDKLDLTVEMEALTIACKRDGLLTEEDFRRKEEI